MPGEKRGKGKNRTSRKKRYRKKYRMERCLGCNVWTSRKREGARVEYPCCNEPVCNEKVNEVERKIAAVRGHKPIPPEIQTFRD